VSGRWDDEFEWQLQFRSRNAMKVMVDGVMRENMWGPWSAHNTEILDEAHGLHVLDQYVTISAANLIAHGTGSEFQYRLMKRPRVVIPEWREVQPQLRLFQHWELRAGGDGGR